MVLAGLLLPVVAGVRLEAQQTVCISNFHQIMMAMQMYRQDYDLPDSEPLPQFIKKALMPKYVSNERVFRCPLDPEWESRVGLVTLSYALPVVDAEWWPGVVARRGEDSPVIFDQWHAFPCFTPFCGGTVIVGRLSGTVVKTRKPVRDSRDL